MGNVLEDQNTAVFSCPILSHPQPDQHKHLLSATSQKWKGRASDSALLLFTGSSCLGLGETLFFQAVLNIQSVPCGIKDSLR